MKIKVYIFGIIIIVGYLLTACSNDEINTKNEKTDKNNILNNKEYNKNIFQVLFYFHHLRIFSLSIKRSDRFCPTHIFYSTNAIKHRFTIICKIVNLITT